MDYERLKIVVRQIKLSEDAKKRIIDAVRQSCLECQQSKEIYPSVIKEPDA